MPKTAGPNKRRFNNNLSRWAQLHPQEAVLLPYAQTDHLHALSTKQGEPNLHFQTAESAYDLHDEISAQEESAKWFAALPLSNIEVLYVYGVGLGYDYESAKDWLKKDPRRQIVFLEDDPGVLLKLFETERGSQILKDPQVQLHLFSSLDEHAPITELYWSNMSIKLHISALRSYAKHKTRRFKELNHKLLFDATYRFGVVSEYLHYGASYYHNYFFNIHLLAGSCLGDGLKDVFKGVPAIICGAGPSLKKHLPELAKLHDKALIFAGGSALNALHSAGIVPHLGAGIDPNPEQLKRVRETAHLKMPLLYRNRMYHPALTLVSGQRLYITGSGGYNLPGWIDVRLGIKGSPIEEGFNVVNFCLDIARVWGCDPLILVGLDLAFTGMQAYAPGVIKDAGVTEKTLEEDQDLDTKAIMRPDINGKPTYTLWKWIAESEWIGEFAKAHPECTVVNATEGGLGFPGVSNVSLVSVVESYLKKRYDLDEILQREIGKNRLPQITPEHIEEVLVEVRSSLLRSQEYLEILAEETAQTIAEIERTKTVPEIIQSGKAALAESELAEEIAYIYDLETFNLVYAKMLDRELRILMRVRRMASWRKELTKLKLNLQRLKFLRDVAATHIGLIDMGRSHRGVAQLG